MFLVFFTSFIFILTISENIFFALGLFILFLFVCVFIPKIRNPRNFLLLLLSFFVAFSAVSIYQIRSHSTIYLQPTIAIWSNPTTYQHYLGTWTIVDVSWPERYIFQDPSESKRILYSQNNYSIWDQIFLEANQSSLKPKDSASSGFFQYQFNYPKRLFMKGYVGALYESNSVIIDKNKGNTIQYVKQSLRQKILQIYGKNKYSWLILWMIIGDKSEIPKDDYDQFIKSGLVHIIAVSGWNIIMIVVFLSAILFFIPFYIRNVIILLVIIWYALICGMDSSVFRATLMGTMSLVALFRWREVYIWRLITISFILMLLINPYFLIYDLWFILSFSALVGLIRFDKTLKASAIRSASKRNKITHTTVKTKSNKAISKFIKPILNFPKKVFKDYLQPSIGATLWVFPILIFFTGEMNLLGILGNLFVLPIVPFVMIYGFLSVFLYQIFQRQRLLSIETKLIHYIYKVSEITSQRWIYFTANSSRIKYLILACFFFVFITRIYKTKSNTSKKYFPSKVHPN